MNSTNPVKKKIVIIGGGFAGINIVQKLSRDKHYTITLVDRNNYNFFIPLLYQVATGFLEISNISYPFRKLLRKKETVRFRLGALIKVEPKTHTCYLDNGEIRYDYLVFATGAETNYFGNKNIVLNAIPMKTLSDALLMRNRLLQTLEQACLITDPVARKTLLTIVVAGGGPTGVEVTGVIAELRKHIVQKDYPELLGSMGDIFLVEGGSRLLAQMSEQSHWDTYEALADLGVHIKLNTFVKDFVHEQVTLSTGEIIPSKSLIWAAGITAKVFEGIPTGSLGKGNRMLVDAYNQVQGVLDIFAVGDVCLQQSDNQFSKGHPQVAQVAIQQGKNLAQNFSALANGKTMKPFMYADKGAMAIIGRNEAVVDLTKPKFHIGGFIALLIWLFIHLTSLLTYQNKFKTLYNWIASYLTRDQSLRMIIRPGIRRRRGER
jgi:NADH:ubiquinone reductase (H+-translocating)